MSQQDRKTYLRFLQNKQYGRTGEMAGPFLMEKEVLFLDRIRLPLNG